MVPHNGGKNREPLPKAKSYIQTMRRTVKASVLSDCLHHLDFLRMELGLPILRVLGEGPPTYAFEQNDLGPSVSSGCLSDLPTYPSGLGVDYCNAVTSLEELSEKRMSCILRRPNEPSVFVLDDTSARVSIRVPSASLAGRRICAGLCATGVALGRQVC